jgi:hypothetical protein
MRSSLARRASALAACCQCARTILIEPAHQYPTDPPPEVSLFHLAVSVTSGYQGMLIVLPSEHWTV